MYLLGRTQMILTDTFEEAIERLMAKGFDGVEVDVYNRDFKVRWEFYEKDFSERMKKIFERCSVKICSVGAHMDYTANEETFNAVRDAIPIAKALGSELVIINGLMRDEQIPYEMQWQRQIQATKELCKTAEQYGIYLALEFEPGFVIDSTERMLQAFDEIDSPMMRVNADIGHLFLQDPDPLQSIERLGSLIVHAHLENMKRGVHNHLVPYEGDMDLPSYINKLRSVGFDGPASFDAYQYDYEAVAEKTIQYFKSIF